VNAVKARGLAIPEHNVGQAIVLNYPPARHMAWRYRQEEEEEEEEAEEEVE
jgi:hypothetical protein